MWQSLREVSLQPLSELCLSFWAIFFNLPVQFLLTTNSAPYWLVLKGYFVFFKSGTPVWPENSSGCWGWRVGLCRLPLRHTTNSMAVLGLGLSAWCWGLTCVPGTAAAPKGGLIMGCANMTGCWGIMVMPVPAGGCKGTKTQSRSGTHECKTRHDTFNMLWNTAEKNHTGRNCGLLCDPELRVLRLSDGGKVPELCVQVWLVMRRPRSNQKLCIYLLLE